MAAQAGLCLAWSETLEDTFSRDEAQVFCTIFVHQNDTSPEETVAYATRSREKAIECEFGDNCERRILEHLIMTIEDQDLIKNVSGKSGH